MCTLTRLCCRPVMCPEMLALVAQNLIRRQEPSLQQLRQEEYHKFKASLSYITSSGAVWVTESDHI